MSKFISRTAEMAERQEHESETTLHGLNGVKRLIAVASGKGGVGKSTVAVNLAAALAAQGQRAGLLDADVYGPSIPLMLDLHEPVEWHEKHMLPLEKYALKVMSIGLLGESDKAIAWRGPMVGKAIQQLLYQVEWGDLDYLIIDLPPGTGDPSMTVAHYLPECHVLMVTTPQLVAVADVRRAIELFQGAGLKIAGLVENMSYFMCGHKTDPVEIFGIFGAGGGQKLSEETGLPLLATVPIEMEISQSGDVGAPLVVSAPNSEASLIFFELARQIMAGDGKVELEASAEL
ncbi:MAG: Mrp/NBP35 family ATP-binding protein [Desulfuromonadales bacterium]|nr:Mrp/NBP35 family ATP-binding protein [Desulfuromonadales bacterium]MBN2793508.1 Mrp/NBP35 family ATP-binding protein [Desulfuromonadales bacterium]